MPSRLRVFDSSVGTKILIGLTGLALFLYLVLHIAGNLLVFLGPTVFNNYSHMLLANPLIYPIEAGLALIFLIHVYKTVNMYLGNQQARPVAYARKERAGGPSRKTFASSTMIFSGLWLLLFVIVHVRGFKFGDRIHDADRRARSLSARDGELQQSADGRLLRRQPARRRLAPLARHPERLPVARRAESEPRAEGAVLEPDDRRAHRRRVHLHCPLGLLHGRGPVMTLDAKVPAGPIAEKWDRHKFEMKLVNPANKRKYTIIVVGTGLAGASAAASLGELGYNVLSFCIQDSPRRAHSIAAQGGINAAKNYQNDGDSVYRLFYDTVKGGDYRSREANVYRLAQLSVNIIDQCVAQGVPFAREYGGLLDNRSFGGAQVSRTFYARGQTGQQLLLGAYQALMRQVHRQAVQAVPAPRDARPRRRRRQGARHHRAATWSPARSSGTPPTP